MLVAFSFLLWARPQPAQGSDVKETKRPGLSLKASPVISFSPARIVLTAELKGGPNDFEEYYCPTVEWDWGDGTHSEATADCEPYEAGKSEIKRRYIVEHVYRYAANYRVQFKLKKKDKVLSAVTATVQVRPGVRDSSIGQ
jgi:hypothetical protein